MSQASSNIANMEARIKSLPAYTEKHEWRLRGTGFTAVVSKHEVTGVFDEGDHRWCVYAYIYPSHPYFKEFSGTNIWQPATEPMPLHGGCTYLYYHRNHDGTITSIQVGCDYNHLGDEYFTHAATKEAAHQVFKDAESLFNWLESRSKA